MSPLERTQIQFIGRLRVPPHGWGYARMQKLIGLSLREPQRPLSVPDARDLGELIHHYRKALAAIGAGEHFTLPADPPRQRPPRQPRLFGG